MLVSQTHFWFAFPEASLKQALPLCSAHAGRGTSYKGVFCSIMASLSCPDMVQPKKNLLLCLYFSLPGDIHLSLAFSLWAAPALPALAWHPVHERDVEGACTEAGGHSSAPRLGAAEGTPSFPHVPALAQESTAIPFSSPSHQKLPRGSRQPLISVGSSLTSV